MAEHQSSTPLLDAVFDACVKSVEGAANWVKEGGLTDMIEAVAAKASDLTHAVAQRAEHFSPFANKSSEPDVPLQQLAISAPEVTPSLPSHVMAHAANAVAGMNVANANMVDLSEAASVSPHHAPAVTRETGEIGLG